MPFSCTGGFSSKVADEMTTTIRFVARAVSAQVALSQVRCYFPLFDMTETEKDSESSTR